MSVRKPRLLSSVALCGQLVAAGLVHAAGSIDEIQPVDPDGVVRIQNARGDLTVRGWDQAELKVTGDIDDMADSIRFEVLDTKTLIQVLVPRQNNWGDGSDLTVWMPRTSGLVIDAVSADVDVDGILGSMHIRTIGGDVEVSAIGGETRIRTVSGDVDVEGGTGTLFVASTSGDLEIEAEAEDVVVDTMTGDIELELAAFDRLSAQTVEGDLEVAGRLNRNGKLHAKTVESRIEVRLEAPVDADVRASTRAKGEIRNRLTGDRPRREGGGLLLRTTAGDGAGEVVLRTITGGIEIE